MDDIRNLMTPEQRGQYERSGQAAQDWLGELVADNHRKNMQAVEYGAAGYGLGMLLGRWLNNVAAGFPVQQEVSKMQLNASQQRWAIGLLIFAAFLALIGAWGLLLLLVIGFVIGGLIQLVRAAGRKPPQGPTS